MDIDDLLEIGQNAKSSDQRTRKQVPAPDPPAVADSDRTKSRSPLQASAAWLRSHGLAARLATVIGVLGSLASVIALFASGGTSPGPQPLTPPQLHEILFSEARELLIRDGWIPVNSPVNPTGNPDVQSGNGPYFVERGYRELVSCSGSGLAPCRFMYRSEAGQYLHLVTVGEEQSARVNSVAISDSPDF